MACLCSTLIRFVSFISLTETKPITHPNLRKPKHSPDVKTFSFKHSIKSGMYTVQAVPSSTADWIIKNYYPQQPYLSGEVTTVLWFLNKLFVPVWGQQIGNIFSWAFLGAWNLFWLNGFVGIKCYAFFHAFFFFSKQLIFISWKMANILLTAQKEHKQTKLCLKETPPVLLKILICN